MNGDEFSKLSDKLNDIHLVVVQIEGKVDGHTDRIEDCEKDRDALFGFKNNHEHRLTKIETYRKSKAEQNGTERHNKTAIFDRIMRILIALFMLVSIFLLATNTYGDNSQFHNREYKTSLDRAETVRSLVRLINDHEITRRLGFEFDCKNPASDRPILDMHTMRSREECITKESQLEALSIALSITWDRVLNYKVVYIYDSSNLLVYMIDKEGKFVVIGDNIS